MSRIGAAILGGFFFLGLALVGYQISGAMLDAKALERTVKVKGLSEREVDANVVIWPILFTEAGNELEALYEAIETSTEKIRAFLLLQGINPDAISASYPSITDRSAQQWNNSGNAPFRYTAAQTVTVYSYELDKVRAAMEKLSDLGKQGIVFTGNDYRGQTQYLYTELNSIKPEMVEEATHNARTVAQKFATDSNSKLGKIRKASQGQFSIVNRDHNTPHIKKVRVVSTIEYYLSD